MSETRRFGLIVGLTIIVFIVVTVYLQLRREHSKDFPFLWGSLFLNGLLLIVAGILLVFIVVLAVRGSQRTTLIASGVLGLPSLALALADYGFTELGLDDLIPGRLIQEPGHEIGMLGLGMAAGLLVVALLPPRTRTQSEAHEAAGIDAD